MMDLKLFESRILPAKDKLYRFALRLLGSEDEAKDLIQEVLIKVWSKRNQIDQLQNAEAWCMRITKNMAIDQLKSKRVQLTGGLTEYQEAGYGTTDTPLHEMERHDAMQRIDLMIAELPEKQREAMHLRYVEGYSYKEISDIMGVDINQVKVNIFRARRTIKEKLLKVDAYGLDKN